MGGNEEIRPRQPRAPLLARLCVDGQSLAGIGDLPSAGQQSLDRLPARWPGVDPACVKLHLRLGGVAFCRR